jgi:hypothetical protein
LDDFSIASAAAIASSQAAGSPRTTTRRSEGATARSIARAGIGELPEIRRRCHDARRLGDALAQAQLGADLHQGHRILVQIRGKP